jgi:hypothetical protein
LNYNSNKSFFKTNNNCTTDSNKKYKYESKESSLNNEMNTKDLCNYSNLSISTLSSNSSSIDEYEYILEASDLSNIILQFNNTETLTNKIEFSNSMNKREYNNLNSMQSSNNFDKSSFSKSYSLENENIFQHKYNDLSLDVNNFDFLIDNEQFELIKNDFNNSNVFDNI